MERSSKVSAHPSQMPIATSSGQVEQPAEFTKIKSLQTEPAEQIYFHSPAWGTMLHRQLSGQLLLSFRPTPLNLVTVGGIMALCVLALVFPVLKSMKVQRKQDRAVLSISTPEELEIKTDEQDILNDAQATAETLRPKIKRITL